MNDVYVDDVLKRWLVELVRATRVLDDVAMGASVRGSPALERGVRAWALLHGRDYVVPVDVEQLFVPGSTPPRLPLRLSSRARASGWAEAIEDFRRQCLELAPVPGSEEDLLFEGPAPGCPGQAVSRTPEEVPRVPGAPPAKEPSERRAGQYSTYGQAPRALDPAASGVRRRRRACPAGATAGQGAVTLPLVPRGRLVGLSFGTIELPAGDGLGCRRVAPVPGRRQPAHDRLGGFGPPLNGRERDEFIVRERFAEEAPAWSSSPTGGRRWRSSSPRCPGSTRRRRCADGRAHSSRARQAVGGFVGYVDFAEGEAYWLPPQGGRRLWELREERLPSDLFAAPGGSVADAVLHLIEHGKAVTPGSFVFCLSDFSDPPPWTFGSRRSSAASTSCPSSSRDPMWEQSFPDVAGIVLPMWTRDRAG